MNNQETHEKLSALLDDELGYHESLALLSRLGEDKALDAKMNRYAVAREFMQSSRPLIPDVDFASRVQAAIADEPVVFAPRAMKQKHREKFASLALAASMAMLAVFAARSLNLHSPLETTGSVAQVELSAPVVRAGLEPDLRDFLTMHNESAYLSGAQGMLPSVRLVSGSSAR